MTTPPLQMPRVQYDVNVLGGGLDLLTPTLSLKAGVCRDALNFEASVTGGYSRIPGYERFDGRSSPSGAAIFVITLDAIANVGIGNTITNPAVTVTGVVVGLTSTLIIYTKAVGTFTIGTVVKVGALVVGTITAITDVVDTRSRAIYTAAAADVYRTSIAVVPGSGPIRGVCRYKNVVYAWRDNAGGTAMAIYKSSVTGWVNVPLGFELGFTTGSAIINEGDAINGQTSGATGTVTRVVLESGTWAGTAAGRLILSATTGVFVAAENIRVGAAVKAVASGAAAAITLLPGGRVRQQIANFAGQAINSRVYGCDGLNRSFEFDGTVYAPIKTGMSPDAPNAINVHLHRLFLTFGGSVQYSAAGLPFQWSPIVGAAEFALDDTVTDTLVMTGSNLTASLALFTADDTFILYGSTPATFFLVHFNQGIGAIANTAQQLDTAVAMDGRGMYQVSPTLAFGNFDSTTLTASIRPFVQSRKTLIVASGINREKNQYRVFYSDGYALYLTSVNNQSQGVMPVLFPNPVAVWSGGGTSVGAEVSFFGSTNGMVYQMDTGTSFDGASISATLLLNFNHSKSPRIRKRYQRSSVEVTGDAYAEFLFGYDLAYSSTNMTQSAEVLYASAFRATVWDEFTWDEFTWDGVTLSPSEVGMVGTGENCAIRFSSTSTFVGSFTINSIITHYMLRRGLRGSS